MDTTETSFTYEQWATVVQASPRAGGGDCARIVSRRDGHALFFIGDVAGHDARAASLAKDLDARVSHLARWSSPGALLGELNFAVEASWPSDVFVSAVCFLLDPATGRGTVAAAGQVPPVIRGVSSSRALDMHAGPALGLLAGQRYAECSFMLEPGDVLVAVTDGVTDPFATGSDLLGLDALARILDTGPVCPVELCASLLGATRRFGLQDDATVLAIAPGLHGATTFARGGSDEVSLAA